MQDDQLKRRDIYLERLIAFQDQEPVKVITGIRRCGKSSLLKLMQKHLLEEGKTPEQIITMNFESFEFIDYDVRDFYQYVKERILPGRRCYIFLDELQRLDGWETAVNAFRVDFDCDIYITGSNAHLLSSEYATYLSGRSVEIRMLPLSFAEFLEFHDFRAIRRAMPDGSIRTEIRNTAEQPYSARDLFDLYLRFGGMPVIHDLNLDQAMTILDGIYSTVVMRDILEREKRKGERSISDPVLLRNIILFLADNIGNSTSARSVEHTLISEGLLRNRKTAPSVNTIQSYIMALTSSYMFYDIRRFDIKGKEYLRTLGKYYIADIGLRNNLLGIRNRDTGHVLENIVYLELLKRGYQTAVGKIGDKEIDFVITTAADKKYIQVTESMAEERTRERELAPLMKIQDNYEKIILAMDPGLERDYNGIRVASLIECLLDDGSVG